MSNLKVLKRAVLIFFVSGFFFLSLLTFFHAPIARFLWDKYQLGSLALFLRPNEPVVLLNIGNHYFGGTRTEEYNPTLALAAYEQLEELSPDYPGIHHQLARLLFIEGRLTEAIEEVNKEIEFNPENSAAFYLRGLIHGYRKQVGDLARAEEDFRYFISIQGDKWAGYNDLAWILLTQAKNKETIILLSEAIDSNPSFGDNPWILNSLGVAYLNDNQPLQAFEILERAGQNSQTVTYDQWYGAYSGNSPVGVEDNIEAFKQSIKRNLEKARVAAKETSVDRETEAE